MGAKRVVSSGVEVGGKLTHNVPPSCAVTKAFVCSGRISYASVRWCKFKASRSHAFTFYAAFPIFSRLALQNRLALVGIKDTTRAVVQCVSCASFS